MSESDFNIQEYLTNGVEIILKDAMRATFRNPKESIFLLKFAKHAKKANLNSQSMPKRPTG